MRAKEYYEKYRDTKWDKTTIGVYLGELGQEAKVLMQKRCLKNDLGVPAVLREINDKHNALMRIFQKEQGDQPLISDMFLAYWLKEMPQLSTHFPNVIPLGQDPHSVFASEAEVEAFDISTMSGFYYVIALLEDDDVSTSFVIYNAKDSANEVFRSDNGITAMEKACSLSGYPMGGILNYTAANKLYTIGKGRQYHMTVEEILATFQGFDEPMVRYALDILRQNNCAISGADVDGDGDPDSWYIKDWKFGRRYLFFWEDGSFDDIKASSARVALDILGYEAIDVPSDLENLVAWDEVARYNELSAAAIAYGLGLESDENGTGWRKIRE